MDIQAQRTDAPADTDRPGQAGQVGGAPMLAAATGQLGSGHVQRKLTRRLQRKADPSAPTTAASPAAPPPTEQAAPATDAKQAPAAPGGLLGGLLGDINQLDLATLQRAIELLGLEAVATALASFPQVLWKLLDWCWPSNTGWVAAVNGAVGATIAGTDVGFPGDVELGAGTGVEFSVLRAGTILSAGVKATGQVSGSGAPSLKLAETPLGITLSGVEGYTLRTDLSQVSWPGSALQRLLARDLRGVFRVLWTSVASLHANTQLERTYAADGKVSISAEAGLDSAAKLIAECGVSAGLTATASSPTQTMPGKAELTGELGLFGGLTLNLAGGNKTDPLYIKALVATVLKNVNAAATNQAAVRGAVGMRATWNMPPLSEGGAPQLEVGIYGLAEGGLSLLGQAGKASGKAEIILAAPDIPGFIAALESGAGVGGQEVAGLIPFSQLNTSISGELTLRDLIGVFPIFVSAVAPGVPTNTVKASFTLNLVTRKDTLLRMAARGPTVIHETVRLLMQGDARGALAHYLHGVTDSFTESLADLVEMVQGLDAELRVGNQTSGAISTPLEGDVTGASGSGTAELMSVTRCSFGAAQLGIPQVSSFLRNLL